MESRLFRVKKNPLLALSYGLRQVTDVKPHESSGYRNQLLFDTPTK